MEPTTIDQLFTAFDVTGLSAKVLAVALSSVGLTLLYAGWRHIKKGASRL